MPEQSTAPEVAYKPIPDWPGYRAGTDGSIWTLWVKRRERGHVVGKQMGSEWTLIPGTLLDTGYLQISLQIDGRPRKKVGAHVLVLLAHVGPCPAGMECAHDNGKRDDNRIDNLAWKTSQQNQADRIRHGTDSRGEKHANAVLTDEKVREIRSRAASGESYGSIGKALEIGKSTVFRVVRGKGWAHVA